MREMWGQAEQAWRDTLIHKAEGGALADNGKLFGFEWSKAEISERAFRSALWEAGYAKRGTKVSMLDVIERAFSDYNTLYLDAEYLTAFPHQLITPGATYFGDDAAGVAADFLYRYIRTPYGVHLVTRTEFDVARAGVGDNCSVLHLCPTSHVFFDALELDEDETMNFYLLPADVREEIPGPISLETDIWTSGTPCYVEIGIREASVTDVPPTFLLDDGDEDTPAEMPFGGQLLDDVNVDGNPSGEGPHPFYLYDGTAFPGLRAQFERLVVTGVHVKVVVDP